MLRIINEPTAAALAYGLDKRESGLIVVYDLGGGTFDVSILEVGDGVFEVKSTNGDTFLGGEDFDHEIIQFLADEFKSSEGIDLRKDKLACSASRRPQKKPNRTVFGRADGCEPPVHHCRRDRSEAPERQADPRQAGTAGRGTGAAHHQACQAALKDAGVKAADIDEVILVGGMTRMPKIIDTVKDFFQTEPHRGVTRTRWLPLVPPFRLVS